MSDKMLNHLSDIQLLNESTALECKLAVGRDGNGAVPVDLWETYSAFANTRGGEILLGIKEKKGQFSVEGIKNPAPLVKNIWDIVNNPNKVSYNLLSEADVSVITLDGKHVIRVFVPRSSRIHKPIFINGNPLTGTYQRRQEADQRCSHDMVRRMFAEQVEDSRDIKVLPGYGLNELDAETLRAYRQLFRIHKSGHPWSAVDDLTFITKLGCWRKDPETQVEGLTVAGLLMFGEYVTITGVLPLFFLDYQEAAENPDDIRWLDRIVPDGTWSGNLFDFYLKVSRKLEADIKIPFSIKDNFRQGDTLTHQALREALINTLVHGDYNHPAAVKVVKSPQGFSFSNPGLMRISPESALSGGQSDCRNRILHQLFLMIGLGERAGSGMAKIKQGWSDLGHSLSLQDFDIPYEYTQLTLLWGSDELAQEIVQENTQEALCELSETQLAIIKIIRQKPSITRQQIADELGNITVNGVKYQLKKLQKANVLVRNGTTRTGFWQINEAYY